MANKVEFFGKQRLTSLLNKLSQKFKKTDEKIAENAIAVEGIQQNIEEIKKKIGSYAIVKHSHRSGNFDFHDFIEFKIENTVNESEYLVVTSGLSEYIFHINLTPATAELVLLMTTNLISLNNHFKYKLENNILKIASNLASDWYYIGNTDRNFIFETIDDIDSYQNLSVSTIQNLDKSKIITSEYNTVLANQYLRVPVQNVDIIDIVTGSNSFQFCIIGRVGTDVNYCQVLKFTDEQFLNERFDFYYDPSTGDRYVHVKVSYSYTCQGYLERVSSIPETAYKINPVIETIQNINDLSFPSKIANFTMNDVIKFPYRNLTDGGFVTLMMTNGRNVDFFNFSTVPGSNQILRHIFSSNLNFKHGIFKRDLDSTMYYIPLEGSYVYAAGAFEIVNSSNVPETAVEVSPTVLNIQNVPSSAQLTNVELALAEMYEQNLKEES